MRRCSLARRAAPADRQPRSALSLDDDRPRRRDPRWPDAIAWMCVLAGHWAMLWYLLATVAVHAPRNAPTTPAQRVTLRLIPWSAPPAHTADPPSPAPPATAPRRRTSAARGVPDTATLAPPARHLATAQPQAADAADPAASAPIALPSLLDTAATRRAIRASARIPGLGAQATAAIDEPRRASANERLADDMKAAGKGDCAKGDYAGAGMGILSLPFLAVAAARGACAQ